MRKTIIGASGGLFGLSGGSDEEAIRFCIFGDFGLRGYVVSFQSLRATPNDPKLSHGGGWRDGCVGEGGGAASVTAGAVGCSAWLGVACSW